MYTLGWKRNINLWIYLVNVILLFAKEKKFHQLFFFIEKYIFYTLAWKNNRNFLLMLYSCLRKSENYVLFSLGFLQTKFAELWSLKPSLHSIYLPEKISFLEFLQFLLPNVSRHHVNPIRGPSWNLNYITEICYRGVEGWPSIRPPLSRGASTSWTGHVENCNQKLSKNRHNIFPCKFRSNFLVARCWRQRSKIGPVTIKDMQAPPPL